MSAISTSTVTDATAYGNQRKIDRCQNGVIWAVWRDGGSLVFRYSTDEGANWQVGGSINTGSNGEYPEHVPDASLFIDLDDFAHLVYSDGTDGRIKYRRGAPNVDRTTWTWSAPVDMWGNISGGAYPDVVAHREGTGWVAHVIWSGNRHGSFGPSSWKAVYSRLTIAANGTLGTPEPYSIIGQAAESQNNNLGGFPSIDFHHTGDGKTVKSGAPHLFTAWSNGTGQISSLGLGFRKATYSAGSWSWGGVTALDTFRIVHGPWHWLTCQWDGTRAVVVGFVQGGGQFDTLTIWDRDLADTTTTSRSVLAGSSDDERLYYGSATYDIFGNVHIVGRNDTSYSDYGDLVYRVWNRSTGTLSGETLIDAATKATYFATVKRGYSGSRFELMFTDDVSSPFTVDYRQFIVAGPPTAPTVTAPNGGESVQSTVEVTHINGTDPNGDALVADIEVTTDGGVNWTRLVTGTASLSNIVDLSAFPDSSSCRIRVRNVDSTGLPGPWDESNANFAILHNRPPNAPSLVSPANASHADLAAGYSFHYTKNDPDPGDTISGYALRRKVSGAPAYEFWNATLSAWQSSEVVNNASSSPVVFGSGKWVNGVTYNWSIRTRDAQLVLGPYASDFTVTGNEPPSVVITAPSDTVTTTTRPVVSWSYTDPEGDPQESARVRIFTAAQYTAGGFDPATSASAWDSGVVPGASRRDLQVETDLSPAIQYRAYLRVVAVGGNPAPWTFSPFTINVTPPIAPTLTVTDQPSHGRVVLAVQGNDDGSVFSPSNTVFLLEYSDSPDGPWLPVRGAEAVVPDASQAATAFDYEAPPGVPRSWRATTIGDV